MGQGSGSGGGDEWSSLKVDATVLAHGLNIRSERKRGLKGDSTEMSELPSPGMRYTVGEQVFRGRSGVKF